MVVKFPGSGFKGLPTSGLQVLGRRGLQVVGLRALGFEGFKLVRPGTCRDLRILGFSRDDVGVILLTAI